jgi:hypothetical protein
LLSAAYAVEQAMSSADLSSVDVVPKRTTAWSLMSVSCTAQTADQMLLIRAADAAMVN